nr:hypothetical protein [Bradyrhizobium diazoefficiens]
MQQRARQLISDVDDEDRDRQEADVIVHKQPEPDAAEGNDDDLLAPAQQHHHEDARKQRPPAEELNVVQGNIAPRVLHEKQHERDTHDRKVDGRVSAEQ